MIVRKQQITGQQLCILLFGGFFAMKSLLRMAIMDQTTVPSDSGSYFQLWLRAGC